MRSLIRLSFLFLSIVFWNLSSIAQNQQEIKNRIETRDGNEYLGQILEQTADIIRLKTENLGEITLKVADVIKITPVGMVVSKKGEYWLENPQATRYFWAPNGYNLKRGEGYYQNVWVLFNQVTYGITDHFSAGLGVIPVFLFGGAPTPAWVTAKVSIPVVENKFNIGGGILAGKIIGEDNTGFGIFYGISTLGTKDKNLNIGLGWGFAGGEVARTPLINFGGMIRTGAKGYIITENYLLATSDDFVLMLMLGGRRIVKKVGLDYGFIFPMSSEESTIFAIPWLGLTIPF